MTCAASFQHRKYKFCIPVAAIAANRLVSDARLRGQKMNKETKISHGR